MIELPEAVTLSKQINETIKGKTIYNVIPVQNANKLAWYVGDPLNYPKLLKNKTIKSSTNHAGIVEISLGDRLMLFSDGINLRFFTDEKNIPKKHQLLIKFTDETFLSASIQMYGGICCFLKGDYESEYYTAALEKPSPLTENFNEAYFNKLLESVNLSKYSVKAFLATEQRIPGVGNGTLQDILFTAKLHPKIKMDMLSKAEIKKLFKAIKTVLNKMTNAGGRNTEKDLFGEPGKYKTLLSKNTVGKPCPICSSLIEKMSYMGGSVYVCPVCQKL